jgi:membrane-associated phospholipid phosphatase
MLFILVGYLAVVVFIMLDKHVTPTPDIFVIFASIVAVILGRTKAFLKDWLPFVVIFLAWEAMRGVADNFGAQVQSDSVIAIERAMFGGIVPSEELQAAFHHVGQVNLLDVAMTAVYLCHFLLPLLVGFAFWLKARNLYYRYVIGLMLMSFAAFFTALLLPVAPPRFAYQYGEALAVKDVMHDTLLQLQFAPITTWAYGNVIGNPVAAFPSLHAAYPFLAFLFLRARWPKRSLLILAYCGVVWFAIVYLAQHYVVDILGGVAYAATAYLAVHPSTVRFLREKLVLRWSSAAAYREQSAS